MSLLAYLLRSVSSSFDHKHKADACRKSSSSMEMVWFIHLYAVVCTPAKVLPPRRSKGRPKQRTVVVNIKYVP